MSLEVHFLPLLLGFFQKTLVKSATIKENTFIKILGQWNTTVQVSGTTFCWQILYRDTADTVQSRKKNSTYF